MVEMNFFTKHKQKITEIEKKPYSYQRERDKFG